MTKQTFLPVIRLNQRLEEQVFEQIFHIHYPKIVLVVFRLVGSMDEAEEIAAEAFWKLWSSPPHNQDNLPGWLYRVATHLGYNFLRAGKRREINEIRAHRLDDDKSEPINPQIEVEREDERQKVRAALKKMPRREVQILILRYSGLSYQEIADALNVRVTSIGNLLIRAEQKFDHIFQEGKSDAPE